MNSILNFFKRLFGLNTENDIQNPLKQASGDGSTIMGEHMQRTLSLQQQVEQLRTTRLVQTKEVTTDTRRNNESEDDGFVTSMAVAAVTDSTMLGYAAGGNLLGSILGESLADNSSSSNDSSSSTSDNNDTSSNSNDDYSSSDSNSDSGSDYSGSNDSSSDFGGSDTSSSSSDFGGSDFGGGGGSDF